MEPHVIYEDETLLVLDKPCGWVVNDAETVKHDQVVQLWLSNHFDFETIHEKEYRCGIVHRLDKETSGLLLIAKTKEAFHELQRQFKERIVEKTYIALVHGELMPKEGKIEAEVGRLPWRRDRFGVLPGGRDSLTFYKTIASYTQSNEIYTLTEFSPKTGRTHQIRIHAKYIGRPIVGDEFYAGRKTARNDRKWCPRLFLHASTIKFINPTTKKEVTFEAKLPEDLQNVMEYLKR